MNQFVIYTDLDGSLIDHYDYSHSDADALLAELEIQGIPVVPTTSKTRQELLHFRTEINNSHPFIIENGAAVLIPAGYFTNQPDDTESRNGFWIKAFSLPRQHWLDVIASTTAEFRDEFSSFSSLDTHDLIELTGLDPASAERALKREYGEPVHWLGDDARKQAFIQTLESNGASILTGGRFLHVSGSCNKGEALRWLNQQYCHFRNDPTIKSIAIGDSQNDVAMLNASDYAIIIRSPVHEPPTLAPDRQPFVTSSTGSSGWNEGVRALLHSLDQ